MNTDNIYSMIFTVVNRGFSDAAMDAARAAGAKGGTIINARGTGSADVEKILGFRVEPEKEVILIVTENNMRRDIMKAIYKAAGLATEGRGFSFSIPIDDILGTMGLNGKKDGAES